MTHLLRPCRGLLLIAGLLLTLLAGLRAQAQATAGFGDWQLHLPTNRTKALADAGNRLYVAAEDAFFIFDKQLNTIQLLSSREGLNDVGVSTLAYDSVGQQVVVAYKSGNLDILRLKDGSIRNLNDIARKEISAGKTINQVQVVGRNAYLASSFGIVVVDLVRLEIRDTYTNIGPGGRVLAVYATAVAGNTLFAATSNGLMRAPLAANLLDFRVWTTDIPARAGNPIRTLAVQDGLVLAGSNNEHLLRFSPATPAAGWQPLSGLTGVEFRQLLPSRAGLLVVDNSKVSVLNARTGAVTATLRPALLFDPRAVVRDKSGAFYLADFANGLLRAAPGQPAEQFVTNAPAQAQAYSVLADARTNTVTVFSGGYADRYVQLGRRQGFFEFTDGQWANITAQTLPSPAQYPNPLDVSRGARTPDGTLYVASYGNGLLEWKGPGSFRLFNPTSNTPNPIRSALDDPNYARITDVATDAKGQVWVVNRHQRAGLSGLYLFDPAQTSWRTLPYFSGSENLDRLALDDAGTLWVSRARLGSVFGLVAFEPEKNTTRTFTVTDGLPSTEIYDIVKDRTGSIWVGTIKGPAVFLDPVSAFDASLNLGFQVPIVLRGEGVGFKLLEDEAVRAIAVDGGNRKWFGTDRGLWLFSADGSEALAHFTTENSPLPSNRIVDVAVNDKTGEVFVVTDAGVVSYRGNATVTEGAPRCASVFPNPVRTDFSGQVGISGLANDAFIKITDVTGKLVYQTRANGGTVTWNLADYNGRRVQSGVYLVLSSDADGKNGCVSKIAVVER